MVTDLFSKPAPVSPLVWATLKRVQSLPDLTKIPCVTAGIFTVRQWPYPNLSLVNLFLSMP